MAFNRALYPKLLEETPNDLMQLIYTSYILGSPGKALRNQKDRLLRVSRRVPDYSAY